MSWQTLLGEEPELAELGYLRLHGRVCYQATVRADGGPRVHPVTPFIGDGRLFIFVTALPANGGS